MVKNPLANAGDIRDMGSNPGWGRSPGGGRGHPLQHSCLENPMDRGGWWAAVRGLQRAGHDSVIARHWTNIRGKDQGGGRGREAWCFFSRCCASQVPFVPLIQFLPQPHLVLPTPVVYTHPSSLGKDGILKTLGDNQKYY